MEDLKLLAEANYEDVVKEIFTKSRTLLFTSYLPDILISYTLFLSLTQIENDIAVTMYGASSLSTTHLNK